MKKIVLMLCLAIAASTGFAQGSQNAMEIAKQQKKLREFNMKVLNQEPTKDAKKQAKKLEKEKWVVPAGERPIAQQLTATQLYGEEYMLDESGNATKRFIIRSGMSTSGTYNSGYTIARNQAANEIAASLKTQIAAAVQSKMDNNQTSAVDATTAERFNQRAKSVVDACLTNVQQTMVIYRRLPNGNFEVQVSIAFDKNELYARLKRELVKEMEKEGDELNDLVDGVLKANLQ